MTEREADLDLARFICRFLKRKIANKEPFTLRADQLPGLAILIEQFTRLDELERRRNHGKGGRPRQQRVSKGAMYQRQYRARMKQESKKEVK